MNTSNNLKSYLALVIIATASVVTGCASTSPNSSPYRTERHSAGGVKIESIRLAPTGKGFRVSGSVGRMVGYDNSPRRHLDVETVSPDGSVLSRVATTFNPNPIRRSRFSRTSSSYAVTLPEAPPTGSVVRVSVHTASRSDCRN
jgi:hypothetical protein